MRGEFQMDRNHIVLKFRRVLALVSVMAMFSVSAHAVALTFLKKSPNSNKAAGSQFPLVMQLVDVNGNPQSGATVNLAVTRGAGSITPTTGTTDSNGMISATVTLDTNPGLNTYTITAPASSAGYVLNVAGF